MVDPLPYGLDIVAVPAKISAVDIHGGLPLDTSWAILGGMESTVVVAPLPFYLIYNPGLIIYRVAPDVGSSIIISSEKIT